MSYKFGFPDKSTVWQGDTCFEIAERFNGMANLNKPGWHTASISYCLDDSGNVKLIDEVKVVFTGTTDLIGIRR